VQHTFEHDNAVVTHAGGAAQTLALGLMVLSFIVGGVLTVVSYLRGGDYASFFVFMGLMVTLSFIVPSVVTSVLTARAHGRLRRDSYSDRLGIAQA
jgi:hypothetical protein